jgi:hypothetical protein
MPQTKIEKRRKAIALKEQAIARHTADLESAEFRLKGYTKANSVGTPDPLIAQCIEAVKEQITEAKDKIAHLRDTILHTTEKGTA